jgi:hypothetical protein
LCKLGIFRKKAVTRVNGVGIGYFCSSHNYAEYSGTNPCCWVYRYRLLHQQTLHAGCLIGRGINCHCF